MPIYRKVNKDFFKKWSPGMAYVLGFFCADGSMYKTKRNTYFIEFQITDKDLLYAIRELLNSNHKISEKNNNIKKKKVYRLQVGSKEIYKDLIKLGLTQAKSKTIKLPVIPKNFFHHFLRGFFDGDGNIVSKNFKRKNRNSLQGYFRLRFTSGSKVFIEDIKNKIEESLGSTGSILYYSNAWRLSYSNKNSVKICSFIYRDVVNNDLIYLQRKYNIFQQFICKKKVAGVA